MIDPYNFSLAQKMTWVKLLLDNQFESVWKTIKLAGMDQQYGDMLWRSCAPECVLTKLHSTMLVDTLRTWYIYRERLCKEIYNTSFCDMGNIQCLWFNRNVRSKTKQYLFYEDWFDKGIQDFSDLLNPPLPGSKLFEELVLDFGVSMQDRRKFNFLRECSLILWWGGWAIENFCRQTFLTPLRKPPEIFEPPLNKCKNFFDPPPPLLDV